VTRKPVQILAFVVACLVGVEAIPLVLVESWMRPRGAFYDPESLRALVCSR